MGKQVSVISFLGTSNYIESHYIINGERSSLFPFVQEAILERFKDDFSLGSHFTVILTEEARTKNWLSKKDSGEALFEIGLHERLKAIREKHNIGVEIREETISDGKTEEELWLIFEKVFEIIKDGDRIILDITHSFRSLPILNLVLLNYARFVKDDVSIEKILYGALEAVGSIRELSSMDPEERNVPVFDLTPFAVLFDWSVAIENFIQTGNAKKLCDIGLKSLKRPLSASRGKLGSNLRDLLKRLEDFSMDVATSRGYAMIHDVKKIKDVIPQVESDLPLLKPFNPLFTKIRDRFDEINSVDEVKCLVDIVDWCYEKDLIQQGLTILRENIVNYVISVCLSGIGLGDFKDENSRRSAERILNIGIRSDDQSKNEEEILEGIECELPEDLIKLWKDVGQFRNDINHAGWTKNKNKSIIFKRKLQELNSRFRELVYES